MKNPMIDVACPQCGFEFSLPVGEALSPLIDSQVDQRIEAEKRKIVEATAKESDERNRLVLAAKDKIISDMRAQIDELRRKADLGSQQVQGEVMELALEQQLNSAFPTDRITPVEKGRAGGDIIHEVIGVNGTPAGAILWEAKNTKTWNNDWLVKVKQDMREAKAVIAVIATATLPKGVELFDRIDSVFVASFRCVLPLAQVLRQVLIDIAVVRAARKHGDGTEDKLMSYVTSNLFRNRIMAVVEGCIALQTDLAADKRATARRWARSQQHMDAIVNGTAALYGDLQGVVGNALPGVAGLTLEGEADSTRRVS